MSKLYLQHDYKVTGKDYVETDGGDTPAGGGVNYSTEEQEVGTGLDGESVYEITLTTPDSTSGDESFFNISGLRNVEIICGYIDIGTADLPLNFWLAATTYTYSFVDLANSRIIAGIKGWTPTAFKITIRYQKIT